MHLNILAFAIPLFVIFMVGEYLLAKKRKLRYFNLHNSAASISVGIAERLLDVFVTGGFFFIYDRIQHRWGIFNIRPGFFLWILLLLSTDFLWYGYHRLGHEINLFWAAHIVHHQSDDFNYTVSARITVFQALVRTGFWSVLPLLGFPAAMISSILLVHGLYPFFIHTRLIGKLGILEYILVTPSHHRVHHAANEKYLDKNYGDVFIIWDKIFGTFQPEQEDIPIKYGLTKPLTSYSFLWQHFHFPVELLLQMKSVPGWKAKLKVLFARPDSLAPGTRDRAEKIFKIRTNQIEATKPLNRYVGWQLALTITCLFVFILLEKYVPTIQKWGISLIIFTTLVNCGAIMEQKRWICYLEFSRLVLVGLCLVWLYPKLWLITGLLLSALILIYYYKTVRKYYFSIVYTPNNS